MIYDRLIFAFLIALIVPTASATEKHTDSEQELLLNRAKNLLERLDRRQGDIELPSVRP